MNGFAPVTGTKKSTPEGVGERGIVTGIDLHFRPGMGENEGVAAVFFGGKQQSTGLLQ